LTTGIRVNRESISKMLGGGVFGFMAVSAGEKECFVE
jgi:hypothetical protein